MQLHPSNLTAVSFANQSPVPFHSWKTVKAYNYRSFNTKKGQLKRGGGVQPSTITRMLFKSLASPWSTAMWRKAHMAGLHALQLPDPKHRLAIRSAQFATANRLLLAVVHQLKQYAHSGGYEGRPSSAQGLHYALRALAWLKPVLDLRESKPDDIFPLLMRSTPLGRLRVAADLESGASERWTVHFAPWLEGFRVTDAPPIPDGPNCGEVELLVKAASYALDFMANYAPFSLITACKLYIDYKDLTRIDNPGNWVVLKMLHEAGAAYGPEEAKQGYERQLAKHQGKVRHAAEKGAAERAAEKRKQFQRENRLKRLAEIREEKRQLLTVRHKFRDHARYEALTKEAQAINNSKHDAMPLTDAQEIEIQEILGSVKKCVDAA